MSRYRFIQQRRGQYALRGMCQVLDVSRSGYYAWLKRPLSRRGREDGVLLGAISDVHRRSHGTYGSPRVQQAVAELKYRCGRQRVAPLMRQEGVYGVPRPRKRRTPARWRGGL
jgi:putative transposase